MVISTDEQGESWETEVQHYFRELSFSFFEVGPDQLHTLLSWKRKITF